MSSSQIIQCQVIRGGSETVWTKLRLLTAYQIKVGAYKLLSCWAGSKLKKLVCYAENVTWEIDFARETISGVFLSDLCGFPWWCRERRGNSAADRAIISFTQQTQKRIYEKAKRYTNVEKGYIEMW